jgi:hypothetical protein
MGNKLPTLHAEVPAFYGKWPQGKCPRALDPWRPAGVPIPIAGAHFKDPAPPRRWLLTDDARPNERQTRDAEQAEHDLVNPMIADAMVSARAKPSIAENSRQGPQQQAAFPPCQKSFHRKRCTQDGQVICLETPRRCSLFHPRSVAHTVGSGPQSPPKSTEDTPAKADRGISQAASPAYCYSGTLDSAASRSMTP